MENTKERSTTGEGSLPHPIQHIYERSANPRWNEEFHIRRRPVRHSPVPYFQKVRQQIEEALGKLTHYYRSNSLCANPDKTQVTAFHMRNREAKRSLQVSWNGVDWENTDIPKYLGVTLNRTLSYNTHTQHQDEGGNPKQPTKEISKFYVGNKCKDNQNHSLSLMLLYC